MQSAVEPAQSVEEVQRELIEEFEFFDDWTDRYQYLIDLGRKLPEFPAEWRDEDHLLHGTGDRPALRGRHLGRAGSGGLGPHTDGH